MKADCYYASKTVEYICNEVICYTGMLAKLRDPCAELIVKCKNNPEKNNLEVIARRHRVIHLRVTHASVDCHLLFLLIFGIL